jgi:hypothetical protein
VMATPAEKNDTASDSQGENQKESQSQVSLISVLFIHLFADAKIIQNYKQNDIKADHLEGLLLLSQNANDQLLSNTKQIDNVEFETSSAFIIENGPGADTVTTISTVAHADFNNSYSRPDSASRNSAQTPSISVYNFTFIHN